MKGETDETVGAEFRVDFLQRARDQTLEVVLEASRAMKPGISESEAKIILTEIQARMGALKSWHPPQIRFGENTLLPFGEKGQENVRLKPNDIFFFDIGPIFDGHEGDVGRPFVIGHDLEMERCCKDAADIWHEVRDHWHKLKVSGRELYCFAEDRAQARGWCLSLKKANGHRIADFPHAARARGSIEGFEQNPSPNRWILEIQIRHPKSPFGAFFEDLLT